MSIETRRLITRLGHQFTDLSLLEQALTHRSFSSINNERLEFLGDAILGMTIAEQLFCQCPEKSEGSLTRMRSSLVKKETLAEIARNLKLGPRLNLGSGELKSGGKERDSILADAVEALIGAVFVDAGMEKAQQVIRLWFNERISFVIQEGSKKDPKTELQEYLQARNLPLPDYQVLETFGEQHQQQFRVLCRLESLSIEATAEGASKRVTEKAAAAKVLKQLGKTSE